ncbi:Glucose-repressible alcohol dehydrogenase transcriptional effector [Tieghemiomyces parasiticus]|uniref:poly(A)-specific ribonuclease n=1 Tax=Tieghemiomyces parasiticus TaxID=78921 RepID=A0A9W8AEC9_9FUNG|nr:Glucose-repressible alcohol dehydrogenase transcriptional effector [Tieghemiomyces parasiticus]
MYYGPNTGVPSPHNGSVAPGSPTRVSSPGNNIVSPSSLGYAVSHNASPLYSNVMPRYSLQASMGQKLPPQMGSLGALTMSGNGGSATPGPYSTTGLFGNPGTPNGGLLSTPPGGPMGNGLGVGHGGPNVMSPGMHPSNPVANLPPVAAVPLSSQHQQLITQHQKSRSAASAHFHARTALAASRSSQYSDTGNGTDGQGSGWTAIDLGGMDLRSVSPELFRYDFLTKVYLNHNRLAHLPAAIQNLTALTVLDASGNQLTSVPPELGMLTRLKELLLFDNSIANLPFELGTLYNLETLGLEGNPLQDPLKSILQKEGTGPAIAFLRDNAPAPPQPRMREWVTLDKDAGSSGCEMLSVLSYNILSSKYASPQMYGYVPSWVLTWEYRKEFILQEIQALNADVVCLQEVEASQYEEFFRDQLSSGGGYAGTFWPKSRARTMTDQERKGVDGCAIFYKATKFNLIEKHVLEFQQAALQRKDFEKSDDAFNRFMTKDNITGFALLEHKAKHTRLLVANSHIHWDPEFTDVKVVQVAMLMEEVERLTKLYGSPVPKAGDTSAHGSSGHHRASGSSSHYLTTVLCGDFNSTPDSGVVEYITRGALEKSHDDLARCTYSKFMTDGFQHGLPFKSAYASVNELPFTNFTPTFRNVIDYIYYTNTTLTPTGLLGAVDTAYAKSIVGLPNAHYPSDHISLMAEFKWRPSPSSTASTNASGSSASAGGHGGSGGRSSSFGLPPSSSSSSAHQRSSSTMAFQRITGESSGGGGGGSSSQFRKPLSFKK